MLEQPVEDYLHETVTANGGYTFKLIPVVAGIPDRLVAWRGQLMLVECKRPVGGRISLVQKVWHSRLRKVGVDVYVISTKEEIDRRFKLK